MSLPYPYHYPLSNPSQPSGNKSVLALNGDLVNTQYNVTQVSTSLNTLTGNKNANYVYAGPISGVPAAPAFRGLVGADLPPINLASNLNGGVSGVLGPVNGGTGTSSVFTLGSVVFVGASGVYSQDNANFFWDDTNDRLGLGVGAPLFALHSGQTNKFQSFVDISTLQKYFAVLFNNTVNNSLTPVSNSFNHAVDVNLDVDNTNASVTWIAQSSNVGTHAGSSTSVGTFIGSTSNAFHNATSNVNALYGSKSSVNNNNNGIISNAYACCNVVANSGTGSVSSAYGVVVNNGNGTGVINSNNGLYVNPLSNTLNGISTTGGYFGFGAVLWMPFQGGNTSGTNYNYGLVIEGTAGTAGVGGTVNNVAIAVASAYPSYFANWVAVNQVNLAPLYPVDCAGEIAVTSLGHGFRVKEGANAKQGVATLVGGSVVVANTSVTATSRIFLTNQVPSGTVGSPYVSSRIAGTSFTIQSTNNFDTSLIAYLINEPA